jgi:rRNA maturation endonuclease Nob1
MCSIGGPIGLDVDELKWYKYRCIGCGHVYKSTGRKSVCPKCRSEDVENVQEGSGNYDEPGST